MKSFGPINFVFEERIANGKHFIDNAVSNSVTQASFDLFVGFGQNNRKVIGLR